MMRVVSVVISAAVALCASTPAAFAGVAPVPEPSSMALLAGGVGAVYLARKLRRSE